MRSPPPLLAVGVLVLLVGSVFVRALHALNLDFFIEGPGDEFGQTSGGIAPAFVGTFMLDRDRDRDRGADRRADRALRQRVRAAAARASRFELWLDVLNGFPSIVIGIFVFALLVIVRSGSATTERAGPAAFALSIIMLPLVSRTTMEVLALVPNHLREASYALGVSKWRTVLSVVLPSAAGGILTGHDARGRARRRRDGAAALRLRRRRERRQLEPVATRSLDPVHDLRVLGATRPAAAGAGLGGGVRADHGRCSS